MKSRRFLWTSTFPELGWLFKWLAAKFPDEAQARYMAAQQRIVKGVSKILARHRARVAAAKGAAAVRGAGCPRSCSAACAAHCCRMRRAALPRGSGLALRRQHSSCAPAAGRGPRCAQLHAAGQQLRRLGCRRGARRAGQRGERLPHPRRPGQWHVHPSQQRPEQQVQRSWQRAGQQVTPTRGMCQAPACAGPHAKPSFCMHGSVCARGAGMLTSSCWQGQRAQQQALGPGQAHHGRQAQGRPAGQLP